MVKCRILKLKKISEVTYTLPSASSIKFFFKPAGEKLIFFSAVVNGPLMGRLEAVTGPFAHSI